jgi:hypothetical protein
MRRPSTFDFLVGHRAARISLVCSTVYLLYLSLEQGDAGLGVLFVLSLLLGRYGRQASLRVSGYRQWKASWDAMSGSGDAPVNVRPSRRRKTAEAVGLVVTWAILGFWLPNTTLDSHSATYAAFAAAFGLLTLRGAYVVLRRFARRRPRVRNPPDREFIVRVCPAIPSRSPSLAKISSGLPAYCKALLASRSAPP